MRAKSRRKKSRKCPVDWFSNLIESSEGFSWLNNSYVPSLVWEDPLEKEMATHSSILAWEIPWTEEPGRLQSMGSQRVRAWLSTLTAEPEASQKTNTNQLQMVDMNSTSFPVILNLVCFIHSRSIPRYISMKASSWASCAYCMTSTPQSLSLRRQ